ncbi:hypothetical protein C8R45DRAFT_1176756 [Mycena sanguinolenta]|nr:hypothetical protein C8R45DRAFT_1176756 [Mycena sanguinolenta]
MRTGSTAGNSTGANEEDGGGEYLFAPAQSETVFAYPVTPAPGSGFGSECPFSCFFFYFFGHSSSALRWGGPCFVHGSIAPGVAFADVAVETWRGVFWRWVSHPASLASFLSPTSKADVAASPELSEKGNRMTIKGNFAFTLGVEWDSLLRGLGLCVVDGGLRVFGLAWRDFWFLRLFLAGMRGMGMGGDGAPIYAFALCDEWNAWWACPAPSYTSSHGPAFVTAAAVSTPTTASSASPFAMPMQPPTMSPDAMLRAYAAKHASDAGMHVLYKPDDDANPARAASPGLIRAGPGARIKDSFSIYLRARARGAGFAHLPPNLLLSTDDWLPTNDRLAPRFLNA